MNREIYFDYIEEKLDILSVRINTKGKLNFLDLHVHSENFFMYFLNLLKGWSLENLNFYYQNVEAIDLIDHINKNIIQVSATSTKHKIENTLSKEIFTEYPDYHFMFVSISKPADNLRKKTFNNPYNIKFNPKTDIFDVPGILRIIASLEIDRLMVIYEFIKKELGDDVDILKLDSDLAIIINILSKENLSDIEPDERINSYEIEKKIKFNQLNITRAIIEDYKIYYSRLDKKYKEFDKQGSNKSLAVLQTIRQQYINLCSIGTCKNPDILFLEIADRVKTLIINSKNYIEIPVEELDMCVNIVVVDAFIRCKIFENPEGYNYVTTI